MKKLLAVITLLAFLLLLWFAKNKHQNCCEAYVANQKSPKKEMPKVKKTEVIVKYGPLVHKWEQVTPITNDQWAAKKNEIINQKEAGKVLRITGGYFSDERNVSTYKNMGLARAHKALALFTNDLDTSKVVLAARIIPINENAKTKPFEETIFSWVVSNDNVKEDETGKAKIYFPHASAKEIKNANILNYLKSLAAKAKTNGKTVYVTGYTDNTGNAAKNLALGQRRANSIKKILIQYGVAANKVQANSEGINNPIASNKTKEGRAKNRRVEIELK